MLLHAMQSVSSYMTPASVIDGEGTPKEAAELLLNLTTYIVENGFHLVDFDGVVTTWGDWCAYFNYLRVQRIKKNRHSDSDAVAFFIQ